MTSTRGWAAVSALLLIATTAFAQGKGTGPGRFDPKTVETVSGVVERLERVAGPGKGHGVHLWLRTEKDELEVHLGPDWYVDKQSLELAAQDQIEVQGSRIELAGKPVLIAAEVRKGSQTLMLRRADGTPYWAGGGKRRRP